MQIMEKSMGKGVESGEIQIFLLYKWHEKSLPGAECAGA